MDLLESGRCVKIAAPMVRFSKLPWRHVVRSWGTEIVYSPMIMADSFIASQRARSIEFNTNPQDTPLIVQFAAHTDKEFGDAAELMRTGGFGGGIDLNCGCPQKWAVQEGIGSALLRKPETIKSMVYQARTRAGKDMPISIKIRIAPDLRETVHIVKMAESMGVDFIALHGRTASARPNDPVDFDAIKAVREAASVPLIANGDIKSLEDVDRVKERTGVAGAMAARGLLANPAMFAGHATTPEAVVGDYVYTALQLGSRFEVFHKSLQWMCGDMLNKADRIELNSQASVAGVIDFLRSRGMSLQPSERLLPL